MLLCFDYASRSASHVLKLVACVFLMWYLFFPARTSVCSPIPPPPGAPTSILDIFWSIYEAYDGTPYHTNYVWGIFLVRLLTPMPARPILPTKYWTFSGPSINACRRALSYRLSVPMPARPIIRTKYWTCFGPSASLWQRAQSHQQIIDHISVLL